jgi:hypothetical protein
MFIRFVGLNLLPYPFLSFPHYLEPFTFIKLKALEESSYQHVCFFAARKWPVKR